MHVPVGINSVKNRLKFRVRLSFLNHGQVVAKGAQARLKLLVIKTSRFVLVKVPKSTKPKPTLLSVKMLSTSFKFTQWAENEHLTASPPFWRSKLELMGISYLTM